MKVRRPSASGLDRAFDCPASCWLPEVNEHGQRRPGLFLAEKSSNKFTAAGHRAHNALERAYMGAREADIYHGLREAEVNDVGGAIAMRPLVTPLTPMFPLVEVECWYQPHSAQASFGSTPEHEDPPPEICRGRCDLMGRAPKGMIAIGPDGGPKDIGGKPIIIDHKTGNPAYQTAAKASRQLAFFANWLYNFVPTVCLDGVAVAVFLTRSAACQPVWLSPAQLAGFADELQKLWALLDCVECDMLPANDPRGQQTCKSKSSKWCTVAGCKRSV